MLVVDTTLPVIWKFYCYHTTGPKCPGNPRRTHAKSELVAPGARVARHLQSERDVKTGISSDSNKRNQLPHNNFPCRLWLELALKQAQPLSISTSTRVARWCQIWQILPKITFSKNLPILWQHF